MRLDGSCAADRAANPHANCCPDCNADTYCYPNPHAEATWNFRDYYVRRAGYSTRGKPYGS
jgi:hypothetical protein